MPPRRRTKQELIEDEVEDDIVDDEDDEEEEEDEIEESGAVFESSEILRECHWQRRTIGDLVGTSPPFFFSHRTDTWANWADLFFFFSRASVDMMATPYLELNPDYQRDVVWSTDRMTKLINSLICPCFPVRFLLKRNKRN